MDQAKTLVMNRCGWRCFVEDEAGSWTGGLVVHSAPEHPGRVEIGI